MSSPSSLDDPAIRGYLDRTVRVWLGLSAGSVVEAPALPGRLARLLLRLEEHESELRDPWGRWEFDLSEGSGEPWEPEIDRWVAERRADLGGAASLEPLWPDGRRFAVCLTHDVDLVSRRFTPRQVARYARAGAARAPVRVVRALRRGVSLAPPTRETLERCVAIEAERGVAASYLFTVPPAAGPGRYDCAYAPDDRCTFRGQKKRLADVMQAIAEAGFEVGLHGSYGAGVEPGALTAEREALQRATGLEITSTRQHLLRWDVRSTPRLQEDAGLRVDSSLGFNRTVGFRAGTSLPFRWFDAAGRRPLELLEVPLLLQDVSLLDRWGLGLDLEGARAVVSRFLDAAASTEGAVTLSFHPDRFASPGWAGLYGWSLDRAAELGGWLTSLGALEEWWSSRETRLLA